MVILRNHHINLLNFLWPFLYYSSQLTAHQDQDLCSMNNHMTSSEQKTSFGGDFFSGRNRDKLWCWKVTKYIYLVLKSKF